MSLMIEEQRIYSTNHLTSSLLVPEDVIDAFKYDRFHKGIEALSYFVQNCSIFDLPQHYLELTLDALKTGVWDRVGEAFVKQEFIGSDGSFLVIGPYLVRRLGKETTELTAIYGKTIPQPPLADMSEVLSGFMGEKSEPFLNIIPFVHIASCGVSDGESGEAFIVPDGWRFPHSEEGPALNNMTEQRSRFLKGTEKCIDIIFDETSRNLLLKPLETEEDYMTVQHREYQYHEVGHSVGIGLRQKITSDVLRTPYYRGMEEWKSDGIEFELLHDALSPEEAGRTIAANLSLRFGLDAHRSGGIERDTDVIASLHTFNNLLEGNSLKITDNNKLAFLEPSYEGLVKATLQQRTSAMQIVRDELNLTYEQGIWELYTRYSVSNASAMLFKGMVTNPCRGIFQSLK